jgi:hypothetical protein
MSLISFHKFLISAAILFCAVFAIHQWSAYRAEGGGVTLLTAIVFALAGAGLGFYLAHLRDFLRLPARRAAPREAPKYALGAQTRSGNGGRIGAAEPVAPEAPQARAAGRSNGKEHAG